MARLRRPPAERVRERLRAAAGEENARAMPAGYQRLGRVLLLRLPERLRPYFTEIGAAWQSELGVATVLVRSGPVHGELREPRVERIAGERTETEVVEHGIRWRFDAARIMFAQGNKSERWRAGRLVRPGESVVDLFAGIGYFAIPAARSGPTSRVRAVEKNSLAFRYLTENAALNGVADRLEPILGDNREVALVPGRADRVFLGYLPRAQPWLPRAVELLRPEGGWVHLHTVVDARGGAAAAIAEAESGLRGTGARLLAAPEVHSVKPYGPGRTHVVVDLRVEGRRRT
jgi:tRNA wybutosine-synthesizing protein 2